MIQVKFVKRDTCVLIMENINVSYANTLLYQIWDAPKTSEINQRKDHTRIPAFMQKKILTHLLQNKVKEILTL